jgi:regulator of protease activity HflC (stomatin/prohibitin superfamily)
MIIIGAFIFISLIFLLITIKQKVEAGKLGIVRETGRILYPGSNFIYPWQNIDCFDVTCKYEFTVDSLTKDYQKVRVAIVIFTSLSIENVINICYNYGSCYKEIAKSKFYSETSTTISAYELDSLLSNIERIQSTILNKCEDCLDGLMCIRGLDIKSIVPEEGFISLIREKHLFEMNRKLMVEKEKSTAELRAIKGKSLIETPISDLELKVIEGELMHKCPELILNKWDGHLPMFSSQSDLTSFVQAMIALRDLNKKEKGDIS